MSADAAQSVFEVLIVLAFVVVYGAGIVGVAYLVWLAWRGETLCDALARRPWRLWPIGAAPVRLREVGPHEHRYEARTAYLPSSRPGELPFGIITGYRCRCGKPRPYPRPTAQEQARAALRYMRKRYGGNGWGSGTVRDEGNPDR